MLVGLDSDLKMQLGVQQPILRDQRKFLQRINFLQIFSEINWAVKDISLFLFLQCKTTKIYATLAIRYFFLPVLVIFIAQKKYNTAKVAYICDYSSYKT